MVYDLRPARILHNARQQLRTKRLQHEPAWLSAVSQNAPSHILVRNQPVQHSGYGGTQKAGRKVRRVFQPQRISYPEDKLRNTFFAHHPWELARPRIVQEGNRVEGGQRWDRVRPESLSLQPENVIQRQLWLIEREGKDPATAYDIARREFYRQRMREDVERKVAKEEAMHVGAYFQKSTIAWGMELEDRKFYGFKQWASRRISTMENARQAMILGVDARNTDSVEEMMQSQALAEGDKADGDGTGASENAVGAETSSANAQPARPFQIPEKRKASLRI